MILARLVCAVRGHVVHGPAHRAGHAARYRCHRTIR